jgi:hypothetical protein
MMFEITRISGSGQQVLLQNMNLERAETAAERDLLRGRRVLIAEYDDRMLVVAS